MSAGAVSFPTFIPALSLIGRGCRAAAERNPGGMTAAAAAAQVTGNRTKSGGFVHVNRPFPVITAGPKVAAPTPVPDHILKPDYATGEINQVDSESTLFSNQQATVWTQEEIKHIRDSCQVAKRALVKAEGMVKPGVTARQIDQELHNEIIRSHAYPSILRFHGYPRSTSISVNNVINGIPDDRPLEDGDIVTVDVACYLEGFHGGCARTFKVGAGVDAEGHHLVSAALECLHAGVAACGPKVPFSHIAADVLRLASRRRVGVIKALAGHGIGTQFHCSPDIYHGYQSQLPGSMKPGHVFTVEPCLTEGAPLVKKVPGCDFTLTTTDNWRSAQFQHTVAITTYGVDILSL